MPRYLQSEVNGLLSMACHRTIIDQRLLKIFFAKKMTRFGTLNLYNTDFSLFILIKTQLESVF